MEGGQPATLEGGQQSTSEGGQGEPFEGENSSNWYTQSREKQQQTRAAEPPPNIRRSPELAQNTSAPTLTKMQAAAAAISAQPMLSTRIYTPAPNF